MRQICYGVVVLGLVVLSGCRDDLPHARQTIVTVWPGEHGPDEGEGQGFCVGDGRLVVTAAHLVVHEDAFGDSLTLHQPVLLSRHVGDVCTAEILAWDLKHDVAVLLADWPSHPALDLADAEQVESATGALLAGYVPLQQQRARMREPHAGAFYAECATFSVLWDGDRAGKYVTQLRGSRVVRGFSGSPLLTAEGRAVMGMLCHSDQAWWRKKAYHATADQIEAVLAVAREIVDASSDTLPPPRPERNFGTLDSPRAAQAICDAMWAHKRTDRIAALDWLAQGRPVSPMTDFLLARWAEDRDDLGGQRRYARAALSKDPAFRWAGNMLALASGKEEDACAGRLQRLRPRGFASFDDDFTARVENADDPAQLCEACVDRSSADTYLRYLLWPPSLEQTRHCLALAQALNDALPVGHEARLAPAMIEVPLARQAAIPKLSPGASIQSIATWGPHPAPHNRADAGLGPGTEQKP